MAQPSKAGPAFLTIFALPFLGGGLFFLYGLLTSNPNVKASSRATGLFVASFFVLVGAGLIFAGFKGTDWALRRSEGANKKGYIGAWIAAAFCTLITAPFMLGMIPDLLRKSDPRVFILLGFNLFSAILIINAIRATIRHERFGNDYCEFDPLPISPGRRMTGRIQLRFETRAWHGIDMRLSCVRRIVTGSGKNQSTSKVTLWQADKNVPSSALEPGPLGRAIPVEFDLPADALITDHSNPSDQILWQLHAQADIQGIDYSDDFELPVFRTADSPQAVTDSSTSFTQESFGSSMAGNFGFAAARSVDADSGAVSQPERTKVVVSMHDGGTEFYFPPLRTPGRALMLLVVALVFSGAVYALIHSNVPVLFTALFALGDLLVIFGFFHVTFGSARIGVGNGEILSRRSFLGMGATRRFPFSEVTAIIPVGSVRQGGNSDDNSIYSIQLRTKSGQNFTLADEISSRQEARWVASQLETFAGLKLDTHVEVSLPLGVQTQPVQLCAGRPNVRIQTSGSSWVAFAVFGAMVLAMFAWQARWNVGARSVRANTSRTASRTASSRPKPIPPRVFSGPLTDADVTRVLALPPQAQAEELFERLTGHDERALEVFSQQFDGWIGHINQSDRMSQLLQRAQFSKDLRVRLAHVDMSLALQGFHENQQAADSLMNRASTDLQYRSWAIFYLGMLAARDVEYDRIHQALLNYARNDKDPGVRQWAGLRFLAKDEVLDELFASFTEDPSMKVRDRAGCNLSNCGLFTRKQRMRMVPKLIDLAADPKTNAQMRSWSFLALQEITDANVPADSLAWNRWYADHGTEKIAEFERLEWWQVRGDE